MTEDATGSSESTAESSSESTAESDAEPTADAEPTVPVDEDERAAFHSGKVSSGRETTEDDIDEALYEE